MDKTALKTKKVSKIFKPQQQNEGVGAKVRRVIGGAKLDKTKMDPFIMMDHFNVKLPAGFPDHPHRGFETVTYIKSGSILHEDFKGHKGEIKAGDVQWMTAGKGIVHSEIPSSRTEPAVGFQLWINLASEHKMIEPQYQEFLSEDIPLYNGDGFKARVIAGEVFDVKGPIYARTPAEYIDFMFDEIDSTYTHTVPAGQNALLYVYEGKIELQGAEGADASIIGSTTAVFFETTDLTDESITIRALSDKVGFVYVSGKPLKEKIVSYGPFVMNTEDEINEAISDYQSSDNGFENADQW